MTFTRTLILAFALATVTAWAAAAPARADAIADLVQRADMAYRGSSSAGVFDMHVKSSSYERSYAVVVWTEEGKGKERALIKILGPAAWRGFGTLKLGSQLKLFNPKSNHVTVVSHSMLDDGWMGSHFSNDDLVKETRLARDYEIVLEKEWTGTSLLGDGSTMYRVSLTPRPTAPVAWARIVYEVAAKGDEIIPMRADYYRKSSQKAPSRTFAFAKLGTLGDRRLPMEITVTVASKPGEYTRIFYKKLKLNVSIPANKFSEQALRK